MPSRTSCCCFSLPSRAGIVTADAGVGKDGQRKDSFAPGMEILGKQTLFAEGARGSCSEDLMARFNLRAGCDPQTYGLGLKEVWRVPAEKCRPGFIQHTLGWPLPRDVYGGSFLYHMAPDLVLIGFAVGLDYANPYLNPYQEFQRFKHHPRIRQHLEGGECIQYGARVINEGGLQSIPKLTFPGGALIGCSAGFLNVPKIKGTHTAMKSGMVAADAVFDALQGDPLLEPKSIAPVLLGGCMLYRYLVEPWASSLALHPLSLSRMHNYCTEGKADGAELLRYETDLKASWVWPELHGVRNYHPSFQWGLFPGMLYSGISAFLTKGYEPWTLRHSVPDSGMTKPAKAFSPISYPKPDGKLSFDLLTNLARSGTTHEADQPSHLCIKVSAAEGDINACHQ
jgi:electron-transferring-flavoprotein dehydrogenase